MSKQSDQNKSKPCPEAAGKSIGNIKIYVFLHWLKLNVCEARERFWSGSELFSLLNWLAPLQLLCRQSPTPETRTVNSQNMPESSHTSKSRQKISPFAAQQWLICWAAANLLGRTRAVGDVLRSLPHRDCWFRSGFVSIHPWVSAMKTGPEIWTKKQTYLYLWSPTWDTLPSALQLGQPAISKSGSKSGSTSGSGATLMWWGKIATIGSENKYAKCVWIKILPNLIHFSIPSDPWFE